MIHLWTHVAVVLAMLIAHGLTILIMQRRIKQLENALTARRALLGEDQKVQSGTHNMLGGDTLSIRDVPGGRIDVTVSHAVLLDVVIYR